MQTPVSESSSSVQADRPDMTRVTKDTKHGQSVKGSSSEDRLPVVKRITAAMNRLSLDTAPKKEEKKFHSKMLSLAGKACTITCMSSILPQYIGIWMENIIGSDSPEWF